MSALSFILMADVIGSSKTPAASLMTNLKDTVSVVNEAEAPYIKSPLTITLGDEFQGIASGLAEAIEIIFKLEETILANGTPYRLRHVLHQGQIDTPINPDIAYGMLGPGLSEARNMIQTLKGEKHRRFHLSLSDSEKGDILNRAFVVLDHFISRWKPQDAPLLRSFLEGKDYKTTARELNKDISLMWKRYHSLAIEEYQAQKEIIRHIARS
jgi:hypothetical protein